MNDLASLFRSKPHLAIREIRIPGQKFFHYRVEDSRFDVYGVGSGQNAAIAQTRALYEMFERAVFRMMTESIQATSSGWAAHSSIEAARTAAANELVERSLSLTLWYSQISPRFVGTLPSIIGKYECPIMQIGTCGDISVFGAVVETEDSRKVFITGTASDVSEAHLKLGADAERAVAMLSYDSPFQGSPLAEHHEAFCLNSRDEMSWLYGAGEGISIDPPKFTFDDFKLDLWNGESAFVSRAKSDQLVALAWGADDQIRSKIQQMREVSLLNPMRHPFL